MLLLEIPFPEKEHAKALGARWNPELRKWEAPPGSRLAMIASWVLNQQRPTEYAHLLGAEGVVFGEPKTILSVNGGVWSCTHYDPWSRLPPRSLDPIQLLELIDRRLYWRPRFFCGNCDSHSGGDWMFEGEYPGGLVHNRRIPGKWADCSCVDKTLCSLSAQHVGVIRPTELAIIVEFLNQKGCKAYPLSGAKLIWNRLRGKP